MLCWWRLCRINFLLPGQLFWRPAPLRLFHACFSSKFLLFQWHQLLPQDLVLMHIRLHAQGYGGSLAHHLLPRLLSPSPFLPEHWFFTWDFRGNCSLSDRSNQQDQLKLAGAAKEAYPETTVNRISSTESLLSYLSNSTLQSGTSGHEPCCASPDCSPSSLYFHLICFFSIVWVPPCPFHRVRCIRCKLTSYPEDQSLLLLFDLFHSLFLFIPICWRNAAADV